MKRFLTPVILLLFSTLFLAAQEQSATVITGARLIDGRGGRPVDNATVIIRGNRIESVNVGGNAAIPDGATVIDAMGRCLLPGYIDAHFHMNYPDFSDVRPMLNEAICAYRSVPYLYNHLMGGITTLFDAGGYHNTTLMARKAWREGYITGSRPVVSGERINGTGGHGVSRFDMAVEVDGPDQFRKAVRGADMPVPTW
ncbi:MAG: hypothetical protein R2727_08385 [Bacteroidales bacterium]